MKQQTMNVRTAPALLALALTISVATEAVMAQEFQLSEGMLAETVEEKPYSPYVEESVPTKVYWGDTHLHTMFSFDAGSFGVRLLPSDAYEFARGVEKTSATGQRVRISRPLDFLVVSDHSDNMGFFPDFLAGDPDLLEDPQGQRWYEMVTSGDPDLAEQAALEMIDAFSMGTFPEALQYPSTSTEFRDAWEKTIAAAEAYNDPGNFTAFIGYEWTSQVPPGQNLHRVVIYRDGPHKASHTVPYTTSEPGSYVPEDLWKAMQAYEDATGGRLLAIPHNGNLSNGWMFPYEKNPNDDQPLTAEYVETRARWEPLYEVTQIKGDGETHKNLSTTDEFADYGTWDVGNLNLSELKCENLDPGETCDDRLAREYARSALQIGLQLEDSLGTNPYKFGMIGSTDSHTALVTAQEDNFWGKHAGYEPKADRWSHPMMEHPDDESAKIMGWEQLASGLAAVWARENTRKGLFDAMKRRETYATTGTRMTVRFFGGWDFVGADANTRTPAAVGYQKGVPMGGDIEYPDPPVPGKAPNFLAAALKDPIGANLDRIQIIKGWVDAAGERQERIFDVAVSDGRTIDADGRCRDALTSAVDVANASWSNSVGATELIAVWQDPDFDPTLRAFYYVRVLEISTPWWTAYDAKHYGVEMGPEVLMESQERAYTSPIWYTPPPEAVPLSSSPSSKRKS